MDREVAGARPEVLGPARKGSAFPLRVGSVPAPWRWAGAVALLLAYALVGQGARGIFEPDEGRYTDIALEMLASGDFLTPAFNHEVPHFAKPPMVYWAIAGSVALLGRNEWAVRLPNAVAFTATVLLVAALARRLVPREWWLAPLVYATFLLPAGASNVVTTDTLLTLFETAAVLGFVCWWPDRSSRRCPPSLAGMWLAFGLAFLTKGPPGLLPLAGVAVFVALAGGAAGLRRMFCLAGLGCFVVAAFTWYAAVALTYPHLLVALVHDEVVGRIASDIHHRNAAWYGALFVYGPTLLLGSVPWTAPLLRAAWRARRTVFGRTWWRERLTRDPWAAFLACWILVPLAVFAASRSRLPLYILPLFAPLAVVVARQLRWPDQRRFVTAAALAGVLLSLGIRGVAAALPSDRDARRLAQEIVRLAPWPPGEVVFVDSAAVWGLALYLPGATVESVLQTSPRPLDAAVGGAHDEKLRRELVEREPRTVILARPSSKAAVADELQRTGRRYQRLGRLRRWEVFAVE